jgi:putative redox protein
MASRIERITFPGSQGAELAARLDLPAGPPRAFALFAHCFTCSKDIAAASRIANALTDVGFGVLRFDFTGLGMSGGEFANTNFTSNTDDLVAAADWLRTEHRAPQILVGHSLGGSAVLAVAASIPEVRAVATIGAPASPEHVTGVFESSLAEIAAAGVAEVQLAGRPFMIRQQFVDDLRNHVITDRVATMKRPLLVLHSPIDNTVSIDHASEIFGAARHPKSFVSLDGADHLLSDRADAAFAAAMIGAFADRYIVDESGALEAPRASAPVVVSETSQGPFLNHVVVGRRVDRRLRRRAVALRLPRRSARCVHVDDPAHVRRPQVGAPRPRHGCGHPRQGARERLRRVRGERCPHGTVGHDRPLRTGDHGRRGRTHRRAAGEAVGDRRQMSRAPHAGVGERHRHPPRRLMRKRTGPGPLRWRR